jgi:hypothetical protein
LDLTIYIALLSVFIKCQSSHKLKHIDGMSSLKLVISKNIDQSIKSRFINFRYRDTSVFLQIFDFQ